MNESVCPGMYDCDNPNPPEFCINCLAWEYHPKHGNKEQTIELEDKKRRQAYGVN